MVLGGRGPTQKVTGNVILSALPSDNTHARVSLCLTSIVWNTSALMKIIFSFRRSGSDRWRNTPRCRCASGWYRSLTVYVRVREMRALAIKKLTLETNRLSWAGDKVARRLWSIIYSRKQKSACYSFTFFQSFSGGEIKERFLRNLKYLERLKIKYLLNK